LGLRQANLAWFDFVAVQWAVVVFFSFFLLSFFSFLPYSSKTPSTALDRLQQYWANFPHPHKREK
jgi:hypothetical protein